MPSSPDADDRATKPRAKTAHFRVNERSMTSDAGQLHAMSTKQRTQTPRFRMNDRSFTSDAGKFGRRSPTLVALDEDRHTNESSQYPELAWQHVCKPVLKYCHEIIGLVLHNAKPLIAYAVFAYLIGAALMFGSGFLTTSINRALSPICRLPGASTLFSLPFCTNDRVPEIAGPAEFDKLVQAQSAFNDILAASETGANLPLDMKKSEAGIRDLKHVVEYSSLPSKKELVYEFGGFIDTARQASQDLSRFNTRIGHAVDRILSTNRWTLNVIDGVRSSEDGSRSSIGTFLSHINVFAPFQPVELSQDLLLDQYLRHTSAVEEQILNLITEAQALLNILDNLDGRLDVIASIATRDGIKAEDNKEELFAYLWTKLGGNRSSVKKLENQIQILRDVGTYKKLAWAHVASTIVKLQSIRDNLEDLRERVAMPETVGVDKVPLQVHIEAINLGIERLEEQRGRSKSLERETHNRILSRAELGDGRMIGQREI